MLSRLRGRRHPAARPCGQLQGRPPDEEDSRQPRTPKWTQTGKPGSLSGPCTR